VVKAAQERESLQRDGDELDGKVRLAESEVQALEATLAQLVGVNSAYHTSLKIVDRGAAAEQDALRGALDAAYDTLRGQRGAESALGAEVAQAEGRLQSLSAEQQGLAALVEDLQRRRADADAAAREQGEKQARAAANVKRLTRLARARMGLDPDTSPESAAEKDIRLAALRDTNRAMLQELYNISLQRPDAGIGALCEAAGLKLASAAGGGGSLVGSRASSRAPSLAGSVKSMDSARSGASGRPAGRPGGGVPMRTVQLGGGL
jgi:hypothetical protein